MLPERIMNLGKMDDIRDPQQQDGDKHLKKVLKFAFIDIFPFFESSTRIISPLNTTASYSVIRTTHVCNPRIYKRKKSLLHGGKRSMNLHKHTNLHKNRLIFYKKSPESILILTQTMKNIYIRHGTLQYTTNVSLKSVYT